MSDMIDPTQKSYIHPVTGLLVVETVNDEPTLTQTQWKDECDINNIMKKYSSTGEWQSLTRTGGVYADFSEIQDYQGMLAQIKYADEAFISLPPEVRKRFNNNPGELLHFLQDSNNYEEGLKLGLVNPKPIPNTPVTPPINNNINTDIKKT